MIVVRSLIFIVLFYLWSLILGIVLVPTLLGPRSWAQWAIRFWTQGVIELLEVCCAVKVELRGRERLPKGRALIAAKHQCMFDVFAQYAWLADPCFTMKKELTWIPIFGWWAAKTRTIVLDREGGSGALRKLLADARDRLAHGRQILIFPEGTRVEPGKAGEYLPGVAGLYRDLGLPVCPVATNSGVHWPAHGFVRHPGTIVFEYLEPIPAGLKRAEFMRLLEERIETASSALLSL